jgi:hypothetical protein
MNLGRLNSGESSYSEFSDRESDYRWLTSDAASKWLEFAAAADASTLKLAARLRKDLTAEQVHLVLEQTALRRRAADKFSLAAHMFFTAKGLEQATDEWVAAHKAERFAGRGDGTRADLCCGIGGDLLALAGRGAIAGVDREPVAAFFADANVAAWRAAGRPLSSVEVRTCDAAAFDATNLTAWHLDPDRRPAGCRTTRVVAHDPPPDVVERLLAECPNGVIKLAPAAELPDDWASRAELEWISRGGECRQLVAWFGELAKDPTRRLATVLAPRGTHHAPRTVRGDPNVPIPIAPRVGRFVFEPDAAVLAAKLTGAIAAEHGLSRITPGIAYLTGDSLVNDAALACFEVLELLQLRATTLREWLRERSIGRLEIKKRGVDVDPERLRQELRPAGDTAATLIVTRIDGRRRAIAARRTCSERNS